VLTLDTAITTLFKIVWSHAEEWYKEFFKRAGKRTGLPPRSEEGVVVHHKPFFDELNALIQLATWNETNSSWLVIDAAKYARNRRVGGTPERKEPDRVAFWWDGRHARSHPLETGQPLLPTQIPCHLVGDYKMYWKFQHAMVKECAEGMWRVGDKTLTETPQRRLQ
jgi:hypothetical protein